MHYERLINMVLRAYGQSSRHGLDQETLTLYSEGPYTLYKLTSHFDRRSILCWPRISGICLFLAMRLTTS
jgi:hypothetical protein